MMTDFFSKELKFRQLPILIPIFITIYFLYAEIILTFFIRYVSHLCPLSNSPLTDFTSISCIMWFCYAYAEESLFRAPLFIFTFNARRFHCGLKAFIILSIFLSIAFGSVHAIGHYSTLIFNICVQGVYGFGLCMIWLKAGGLNGKFWKPIFTTTLFHGFTNITLITICAHHFPRII